MFFVSFRVSVGVVVGAVWVRHQAVDFRKRTKN
jgi:hypothetical protein